ncbi:hypothetical protein [Tardiphaga sp. 841_E9_N1_2]|uniref:hypothetical protein n=1 Tax=Tardiphaga sp. 841_E9_N1_2 TaxID=3240762 RepID=UPI003F247BD0
MMELPTSSALFAISASGLVRRAYSPTLSYAKNGVVKALYRPLLVARSAQITGWKSNDTFKIVRDQLGALVQRSCTLMIGMSAQDENIKDLFATMNAQKGWKWSNSPTPIVFSAQDLGDDQKNLLIVAYGEADYEAHRAEICEAARLQAYAKPLLVALLLHVLTSKLEVLVDDAPAANLDASGRTAIVRGLRFLRDRVAVAGNSDRLLLARAIASGLARARHQLQNGTSAFGIQSYFPIDGDPAHLMKGKLGLKSSGQREAAVALGLIGLDEQTGSWTSSIDDAADARSGALRVTSPTASARIFLAANDGVVTNLLECGAFNEDDDDAVVICSGRIAGRQQRSPSGGRRDGSFGPRYLAFGPMLADAASLDDLRDRFREEVSI